MNADSPRPSTSRPRGVCRYFASPRGCYAGDRCKFTHGAALTPYDTSKSCVYYARGYCKHGDKCWFKHVPSSTADDDTCCICLEKPVTYGLLAGCSHIFCIDCIRTWRGNKGADTSLSGVHKKCPLCRAPSSFITPSSHFYPQGSPEKDAAIATYKASMARVPCKYFRNTKDRATPSCPFGRDCFYQHLAADGTPYVFPDGVARSMQTHRRHANARPRAYPLHLGILDMLFDSPMEALGATINAFAAGLPPPQDEAADGAADDARDDAREEIDLAGLEMLADHMLATLGAMEVEVRARDAEELAQREAALQAAADETDDVWAHMSDGPGPDAADEGWGSASPGATSDPPLPPAAPGEGTDVADWLDSLSPEDVDDLFRANGGTPAGAGSGSGPRRAFDLVNSAAGPPRALPPEFVPAFLRRSEQAQGPSPPLSSAQSPSPSCSPPNSPPLPPQHPACEAQDSPGVTDADEGGTLPAHEPPFVTDGRGRVVWSRAGRAAVVDAGAEAAAGAEEDMAQRLARWVMNRWEQSEAPSHV